MKKEAESVREYSEGLPVVIYDGVQHKYPGSTEGRPVVVARCEGGFSGTAIDIFDLLQWVADNKPEWIPPCKQ